MLVADARAHQMRWRIARRGRRKTSTPDAAPAPHQPQHLMRTEYRTEYQRQQGLGDLRQLLAEPRPGEDALMAAAMLRSVRCPRLYRYSRRVGTGGATGSSGSSGTRHLAS
jgi:hypothetical protein